MAESGGVYECFAGDAGFRARVPGNDGERELSRWRRGSLHLVKSKKNLNHRHQSPKILSRGSFAIQYFGRILSAGEISGVLSARECSVTDVRERTDSGFAWFFQALEWVYA